MGLHQAFKCGGVRSRIPGPLSSRPPPPPHPPDHLQSNQPKLGEQSSQGKKHTHTHTKPHHGLMGRHALLFPCSNGQYADTFQERQEVPAREGSRLVVLPRPHSPQSEKATSRDPLSSWDPLPLFPFPKRQEENSRCQIDPVLPQDCPSAEHSS